MAFSIGGLATGMDTNSLIESLMQVERQPVVRLEEARSSQQARLSSFQTLDGKLRKLLDAVQGFDTSAELLSSTATAATQGYFSATASGSAQPGSYQLEVVALAQAQKSASQGYADKDSLGLGSGTVSLTVGGAAPVSISLAAGSDSLSGLADAINAADAGVRATLVNDGTASPWRLVLSGETAGTSFSLDASGLTGGSEPLPAFAVTQTAQSAHLRVDGLDLYGTSNTFSGAIPGMSIDLFKAEPGTRTLLTVGSDEGAARKKVEAFVSAYNDLYRTAGLGTLQGDSGAAAIRRGLQGLLTTSVGGTGAYQTFSELGLETQRDGTLLLNSGRLETALRDRMADVEKLLVGESGVEGVASRLKTYLSGLTDSYDGFLAGRKEGIDTITRQIDRQIDRQEVRLEKREKALVAQFSALEQLVSTMNSQSAYLTQQMDMLSNIWSQK